MLDMIDRMQIDIDLLETPLSRLSGGQKSKIAFARVLYSKSEILLLDEPTNHLDAASKEFVTDFLKNYKGLVLIISHDVTFLDQIINKILFINKVTHKISIYDGDYKTYKKKYAEERRLRERIIAQEEKEIRELEDFVRRANQASRTNHAIKRMGQERALRLEKKRSRQHSRERVYKRVKMDIHPCAGKRGYPITGKKPVILLSGSAVSLQRFVVSNKKKRAFFGGWQKRCGKIYTAQAAHGYSYP